MNELGGLTLNIAGSLLLSRRVPSNSVGGASRHRFRGFVLELDFEKVSDLL